MIDSYEDDFGASEDKPAEAKDASPPQKVVAAEMPKEEPKKVVDDIDDKYSDDDYEF